MSHRIPKLTPLDVLGIAFTGAVFRVANPALVLLLQIAGVVVGVVVLFAVLQNRPIAAIVLAVAAWILWWIGARLYQVVANKPLDNVDRGPKGAAG